MALPYGRLPRGFYWIDIAPEDQPAFNQWAFGKAKGEIRVRRTQRNQKDGWEWVLWEQIAEPNDGSTPYPNHLPPPNTGRSDDTYATTHDRPVVTPGFITLDDIAKQMGRGMSTGTKLLWAAAVLGIGWVAWSWKR